MAPLNVDLHTVRANPLEVVAPGDVKLSVTSAATRMVTPDIIDIRREKISMCLKDDILKGLGKPDGMEKTLPTMLLYSEEGLKIFEEITYLEEYYPTNTEIDILHKWGEHMAERIKDGSVVVELGSGNLRKVNIFLTALERQKKHVDYYALDLSPTELQRTLSMVKTETFHHVRFHGLYGTYDDGRAWFKEAPEIKDRPRCIIHLGSSLGNFNKEDAAMFLKGFAQDVLRPGKPDYMLLGLDGCKEPEKVWTAYNDPHKCTERFIMSGLKQANEVMGLKIFDIEKWEYVGEWNKEEGRHQAYLVPKEDIKLTGELEGVTVKKGERVNIEYSYKFDDQDANKLWEYASVIPGAQWSNEAGDYSLYLLNRTYFNFPLKPSDYASDPLPSLRDWEELWKAWDTVTLDMIPQSQLLSKPINLRNPCIFYLGHIPTFLDVMLQKGGNFKPLGPERFQGIFQRGIDPDVDDPTKCHKHSEIPEEWPGLFEILHHTREVRDRVRMIYSAKAFKNTPLLKRALWTGFEHEVMHLETLLYILLQSDATLPPTGVITPDFSSPPTSERRAANSQEWHRIPATTLTIGLHDPESPEDPNPHHFGWDNEKPPRLTSVPSFTARAYPITNEEYANYLHTTLATELPQCWVSEYALPLEKSVSLESFIEGTFVRTVFGKTPLKHALDWPAMGSYDELEGCARWMGGRIPSADQVRAIYEHAEKLKDVENKNSRAIPAVNGHLVNNGVCETPPEQNPFADLSDANVAFRYWHPTSVRSREGLLGRGETGGAWEWTSTVLEKQEGFEPAKLYPEYTADFFDGKHNVALGGSWATQSRVAGRKSFVNWYQRNYKYVWATARIIREE